MEQRCQNPFPAVACLFGPLYMGLDLQICTAQRGQCHYIQQFPPAPSSPARVAKSPKANSVKKRGMASAYTGGRS